MMKLSCHADPINHTFSIFIRTFFYCKILTQFKFVFFYWQQHSSWHEPHICVKLVVQRENVEVYMIHYTNVLILLVLIYLFTCKCKCLFTFTMWSQVCEPHSTCPGLNTYFLFNWLFMLFGIKKCHEDNNPKQSFGL